MNKKLDFCLDILGDLIKYFVAGIAGAATLQFATELKGIDFITRLKLIIGVLVFSAALVGLERIDVHLLSRLQRK